MVLADARSLRGVRHSARGISVVCLATTVRKRGRLYSAWAVLFFANCDPQQFPVVRGAADRRSMGSFWSSLHCDRRLPYFVRASRSGALELATDCAAGSFACVGRWVAI